MSGLKLNEHVYIAIRPKIIAQHGAEEGEFANMMPMAKLGDLLSVDLNV